MITDTIVKTQSVLKNFNKQILYLNHELKLYMFRKLTIRHSIKTYLLFYTNLFCNSIILTITKKLIIFYIRKT